jgi:hypothetical protein
LLPRDYAKTLVVVILCSIIAFILWMFLSHFYDYTQQQEARARAVQVVDQVGSWCGPETPADLVDVMEDQAQHELESVDPNPEDDPILSAALQNKMESLGCGSNARRMRRLKGTSARPEVPPHVSPR